MKNKKNIFFQNNSIIFLFMPSFLCIFICLICISGTSFAWFTSDINAKGNIITSAYYDIDVQVKNGEEIVAAENNGEYLLSVGTYTITLTAKGNATTGYNKVKIDDKNLYTEQLYTNPDSSQNKTITFTIVIEDDASHIVSFYPVWGTYSGDKVDISNNSIYTVPSEESSDDTIQSLIPSDKEEPVDNSSSTIELEQDKNNKKPINSDLVNQNNLSGNDENDKQDDDTNDNKDEENDEDVNNEKEDKFVESNLDNQE